jgi:hypothetical protein
MRAVPPIPSLPWRPAVVAAALALAVLPAAARADGGLEGETFTLAGASTGGILGDAAASGGKALKLWSTTTAARTVTVPASVAQIRVRAKGQQCAGAPQLTVDVDGIRALSAVVPGTTYADYVTNLPVLPGAHTVRIGFPNDVRTSTCDRNLIVDAVTLVPAGTTAPAPPPSLP